jgi:AcrR family transcriptional regulator
MRHRSDGIETRKRILEAACEVFADKGFRDATVADICRRARTNTASVNYHFRDKQSLYVEAWTQAARRALELYPIDGGVPADAAAEQRLRGHIRATLQRMTDEGQLGQFHRLFRIELGNPTGLIDDLVKKLRKPLREHLMTVLRELLGPKASDQDVELCWMSVVGQCRMLLKGKRARWADFSEPMSRQQLDVFVEHITAFSLAGIRAMRQQIEKRVR